MIINTLIFTFRKNHAMKKLMIALNQMKLDTLPDYEKYYNFLNKNKNFKKTFEKYELTPQDLHDISLVFLAHGFEWENGEYIPVSVISFIRPLIIIGTLKKAFLNGTDSDKKECCKTVIRFLNSY